eukprot:765461-Hanusia_phi.AAC.4
MLCLTAEGLVLTFNTSPGVERPKTVLIVEKSDGDDVLVPKDSCVADVVKQHGEQSTGRMSSGSIM